LLLQSKIAGNSYNRLNALPDVRNKFAGSNFNDKNESSKGVWLKRKLLFQPGNFREKLSYAATSGKGDQQ
jgi:hypothetical protein